MFYSLYATLPWAKRVCMRICVYPTRVYVLKHFKKLNLLNFGHRSRLLPVDYLLVHVAQLFPMNSQLKNYFRRSIKRLQWEGLREERIERKITLLRLSWPAMKILVLPTIPSLQETLVSLSYNVFPLVEISLSELWKELVEGLRLDESEGWFFLEPVKGRLKWNHSFLYFSYL